MSVGAEGSTPKSFCSVMDSSLISIDAFCQPTSLLASITGTVDQELLLRNEYLVTENRILRNQINGRVRLSDGERKALAGGILATYALEQRRFIDSGMYTLIRAVLYRITNVYAVKMAGVFMISLATIWVRTRLMPRWLALLTYVLALGLLLSITSSLWVTLIFPGWVGVVSGYILVTNLRSPSSTL